MMPKSKQQMWGLHGTASWPAVTFPTGRHLAPYKPPRTHYNSRAIADFASRWRVSSMILAMRCCDRSPIISAFSASFAARRATLSSQLWRRRRPHASSAYRRRHRHRLDDALPTHGELTSKIYQRRTRQPRLSPPHLLVSQSYRSAATVTCHLIAATALIDVHQSDI